VQTVDHGQAGRPEPGDELLLTFAGAPDPAAILAAWSGSATAVTVHFEGVGDDVITVVDASTGATLAELGSVQASRDYTSGSADFTAPR
jgi:hypothetical protein